LGTLVVSIKDATVQLSKLEVTIDSIEVQSALSKKRSSESFLSPESPTSFINIPQFPQTIASSKIFEKNSLKINEGSGHIFIPSSVRFYTCIIILTKHT
jgi:hypothetical protein